MVVSNLKLIFCYFALNLRKEWKYKSSFFMQMIMMIMRLMPTTLTDLQATKLTGIGKEISSTSIWENLM